MEVLADMEALLSSKGNVDLSHKRLTVESLKMMQVIGANCVRPIQVLKLGFNDLKDLGTSLSIEWLKKHYMNPKVLDLSFNDIGDEGAKSLAESHLVDTLEDLHLCGNRIGCNGFMHLGKNFSRSTTLRSFHASGNNGKEGGAAYIAEIFNQPHTALNTFIFSGNNIGKEGAQMISTALSTNSTLTHVDLSNNGITDVGAECVAEALNTHRGMITLLLSFNGISAEGMKKLAKSFSHYHALKKVDLDNNRIENDGAEALAEAVRHMSSVTVLNVAFNGIESRGLRKIALVTASSGSLTSLSLSGNKISSDVAEDIHSLVSNSRILEVLSLDHHSLGEAGQIQIASGIASNNHSRLKKFTGFLLGPAMVQLGSPADLAPLTNEKCLEYLHALWNTAGKDRPHHRAEAALEIKSSADADTEIDGDGGNSSSCSMSSSELATKGTAQHIGHRKASLEDFLAKSRAPESLSRLLDTAVTGQADFSNDYDDDDGGNDGGGMSIDAILRDDAGGSMYKELSLDVGAAAAVTSLARPPNLSGSNSGVGLPASGVSPRESRKNSAEMLELINRAISINKSEADAAAASKKGTNTDWVDGVAISAMRSQDSNGSHTTMTTSEALITPVTGDSDEGAFAFNKSGKEGRGKNGAGWTEALMSSGDASEKEKDRTDPRSKNSLAQLQHNIAPALVKRVRDCSNEPFQPGELWELHQYYYSHVAATQGLPVAGNALNKDDENERAELETLSAEDSDSDVNNNRRQRMTATAGAVGKKSRRRSSSGYADSAPPSFSRKKKRALIMRIDRYPQVKKTLAALKEDRDEKAMLTVMRQLRMLEQCKGVELDEEADIEAFLLFSR